MGKMRQDDAVVARLHSYLEEFKLHLPLLIELANPALTGRHWEQIFAIMGVKCQHLMEFTPRDLLDNGLLTEMESVQTVCASASKEYSMLKALEKMQAEFSPAEFRTMPYKDAGTFGLGGIDEIQLVLDDHIVKVKAMNASPFVKPFEERTKNWEKTLITMQARPPPTVSPIVTSLPLPLTCNPSRPILHRTPINPKP
jgi:dynein heavy chain